MKLKIVTNRDREVLVDITSDFLPPIPRVGEFVTSLPSRLHRVNGVAYSYSDQTLDAYSQTLNQETVVNVWCTEQD